MSLLEWTFAATLISRFIALRRVAKSGEPARIQISGGEISKFMLTFVFLYIWNAFWFRLIESI
jgi:hypothetical protein